MALRSLLLQRKRYMLMALAIMVGFALITLIHAATYGALESVKNKAARYFSGHISITGYNSFTSVLQDPHKLMGTIASSNLPLRTVAARTIYYNTNAALFFAGETVRQRRLIGVDFEAEYQELHTMDFSEGSLDGMLQDGTDGILLSQAAADILGCRVGDDVLLYLTSDSGQYNTSTMYVRGIFRETSLFGYVAYVRQADLNRLLLRNPAAATDLALYLPASANPKQVVAALLDLLGPESRALPYMPSKSALNEALSRVDWSAGPVLAALTLDAHLEQITSILDAFLAVTWFILVVFILIVMAGIVNTYRVLVYERTREIGTMRAMGMKRATVRQMFLAEAAMLALGASLAGFGLGMLLLQGFSFIDLGSFSGAGLFTEAGRLVPYVNAGMVGLTFLLMLVAVVLAAAGSSSRAAAITPAEALRSND